MSQDDGPEWPPRSPHAALISTPGGRDRLRRLAERASPSPSPIKRSKSTISMRSNPKDMLDVEDGSDGEEDEETLELKLQEIQMRLKLKKAQKKSKQTSDTDNESNAGISRANSVAASRAQSRLEGVRERQLQRSKSQASIHVPVSPVRRSQPIQEPHTSPKRVLLGIDKGLTGRDISLKRAPGLRRKDDADAPDRRLGPFLSRPQSQIGGNGNPSSSMNSNQDESRPKSFSERMAAHRAQDTERQDREARMRKNRSKAFDINHEQMQSYKEAAVELPNAPRRPTEFSRDDILRSVDKPAIGGMSRSRTTPSLRSAVKDSSLLDSSTVSSSRSESRASPILQPSRTRKISPNAVSETEDSQFEPFSKTHLSKRIIPHHVLTRTLSGKRTFLVPDLLRTVKGPDFSGPDIEEDLVLFAIVAKKTEPRSHVPNGKSEKRGKYMIMGLTDLKWELDLALFDSAFEKFWKITPGTLIAILNPGFMPPPRGRADTGKFSLVLNSDADTILEIGNARDLGFCKSVKKDGKVCDSWIDKRHTEFCDFHVNLTLQKTRASRMEVNTMNFGKGDYGAKKFNSRDMTGHFDRKKTAEKRGNGNVEYDRESHSTVFVGRRTTKNLLDDVDYDPDHFQRGSSKEERMNRQLIAQEKERELERKLGKFGDGMGADYMRAKQTSRAGPRTEQRDDQGPPPPPDAASLGLLGGKARDIRLSPIKRKRANTISSTAARGWGSDLSKDLGRMREGENLQPVKKKTRFVTEKGIREAGRESIGGEAAKAALGNDFDDDDSDLDIVRE